MGKHTLLAGCALSALAMPALALETSVELDGHVGFSGSYYDDDAGDNTNLHNNASRIGLRAAASDSGITGFVRYERGMDMYNPDSDFTPNSSDSLGQDFVREFYAGIDTPYGRVTAGRFRAAYARAGKRVDPFYDTSVAGFSGNAGTYGGQGANYGLSNLTNGFSDRVVELTSANYGGLQFNGNVYVDRGETNDHDYGLGVSYASELVRDQPFEVSLQYLEISNDAISGVPFNNDASVGGSPGESSSIRASGVYDLGAISLGANYEFVDVDAESSARHYSTITATVPLDPRLNLAGAISYLDFADDAPAIDGLGASIGLFYELLPGLNAYSAVRYIDYDDNPASDSTLAVAVGAGYSFDMILR